MFHIHSVSLSALYAFTMNESTMVGFSSARYFQLAQVESYEDKADCTLEYIDYPKKKSRINSLGIAIMALG